MSGIPAASTEPKMLDVKVVHPCSGPVAPNKCIPPGHRLSGPRWRHLGASERVVVTDGLGPVGLAAYKRADGHLRVVHEFLLDRSLDSGEAARVTEKLLSALEFVAYEDGVCCLTFWLRNTVVMAPFERRDYVSLGIGATGIWLQRKLGWFGWDGTQSGPAH